MVFNEKATWQNIRELEQKLLDWLKSAEISDRSWQFIAKTHFEEGFIAFRLALTRKEMEK